MSGVINTDMREHLEKCQSCSKLYEEKLQLRKAFAELYIFPEIYNKSINESIIGNLNNSYYSKSLRKKVSFHFRRNKFNYVLASFFMVFVLISLPMIKNNLFDNQNRPIASKELKQATVNSEEVKLEVIIENNTNNAASEKTANMPQYKESRFATNNTVQNGFDITTFEKMEFAGWLNSKEMLILTEKEHQMTSVSPYPTRGLAIFDISNNQVKEFENTEVGYFIGISPDKSYVLYSEPKYIPEVESSQWQEDLDSGKLLSYEIKLLKLSDGNIIKFNSQYKNKDAAYKWVSSTMILAMYPYESRWEISDLTGSILKSGTLNGNNYLGLTGADIQISGTEITGTIYYKEADGAPTKILAIDINTNDTKVVVSKEIAAWCTFQEGVMLLDANSTREVVFQSLDKEGNVLRDYKIGELANVEESSISPDGSKIVLAGDFGGWARKVMLLDLTTGELKDILTCGSIENLSWSSDGNYISLASRTSWEETPRSYIIGISHP
jgi:hypothetical protein